MKHFLMILAILWLSACQVKKDDSAASTTTTAASNAYVIVTESGGTNVTEGGAADTYTISLSAQPASTVSISVKNLDGQLMVMPATLVFTAANWSTPQTVTVSAIDDAIAEGPHTAMISQKVIGGDINFRNVAIPDVVVQITDNDAPDFVYLQSNGTTEVTEGGAADTIQIKLSMQPLSDVNVTIAIDEPTQVNANMSSLTFTAANWNVLQTVYLTAVDDVVAEDTETFVVTLTTSSGQASYNNLTHTVNGAVYDNDKILYVNINNAPGGDGRTWNTAYKELFDALSAAGSGQQIWVAQGTYSPSTSGRTSALDLKSGVKVYGGFVGGETMLTARNSATNTTILSGLYFNYHVVRAVNVTGSVLDGFTIEKGQANSGTSPDERGAGLYVAGSDITLTNIQIRNNTATYGAGIYCTTNGKITMTGGSVAGNAADNVGGGLYLNNCANSFISGVQFIGNTTSTTDQTRGGGALIIYGSDNVQLSNDFFGTIASPNTSTQRGGAIECEGSNNLLIAASTFEANTGAYYGGAVALTSCSNTKIYRSEFTGNTGKAAGALLVETSTGVVIADSVFKSNRDTTDGAGAIYFNNSDGSSVINSYFFQNSAARAGAILLQVGGSYTVTGSNFEENSATGTSGGGAIWSEQPLTLENSRFYKNAATSTAADGGALILSGTTANGSVISRALFDQNSAGSTTGTGGAIDTNDTDNITIRDSQFTKNKADQGGAIHILNGSPTQITNANFYQNQANLGGTYQRGGAIYIEAAGAGIYTTGVTLKHTTFANNNAVTGGAFSFHDNTGTNDDRVRVFLYNSILWGNTASSGSQIEGKITDGASTFTIDSIAIQGGNPVPGSVIVVTPATSSVFSISAIDPEFVDLANGILRLSNSSPYYNTANVTFTDPFDFDGSVRTGFSHSLGVMEGLYGNIPAFYALAEGASSSAITLPSGYTASSPDLSKFTVSGNVIQTINDCHRDFFLLRDLRMTKTGSPDKALRFAITDDDATGGYCTSVIEAGGKSEITEGSSTTFDLMLTAAPASDVKINVTPDSQVTVDKATLTFTAANWAVPQKVTITAVDDAVVDPGGTGRHRAFVAMAIDPATQDTNYASLVTLKGVSVTIIDND